MSPTPAPAAASSDDKQPAIHGNKLTGLAYVSPYKIYFRRAVTTAVPLIPIYAMAEGYAAARKQFPHPQHVPPRVAWENGVKNIPRFALPIGGTLVSFHLLRCYWEQNHTIGFVLSPGSLFFGLGVTAIPFIVTAARGKPNGAAAAALVFCGMDWALDRWNTHAWPYKQLIG